MKEFDPPFNTSTSVITSHKKYGVIEKYDIVKYILGLLNRKYFKINNKITNVNEHKYD